MTSRELNAAYDAELATIYGGRFVEHTGVVPFGAPIAAGTKGRVQGVSGGMLRVYRTDRTEQLWSPDAVRVLVKRSPSTVEG